MRELKFRYWDYGKYWYSHYDDEVSESFFIDVFMNKYFEPEQYTGIKDAGREVYEGDIYTWCGLTFPITVDDYHGYRFMFGKDQLVKAFIQSGEYQGNIHTK